ncbi:deoxycytidylate deaminase isoform X3 [Helicoverpa armigera]|uniref:deoxycytidylate deaminase isoform X3 n=1 Tax=Helicoverpa armigera TaxID=29058 RepID=UPI0030838E8C
MDQPHRRTRRREDVISWQDYFMAVACLAAQRSKDPDTQVGACIVNKDNRIISIGYNGLPNGYPDAEFTWAREDKLYVCHAEMNAIVNKNCTDVKGCHIYVKLFPCNECAKIIIQSGISKVYYLSDEKNDKRKYQVAQKMFIAANVEFEKYVPTRRRIEIIF